MVEEKIIGGKPGSIPEEEKKEWKPKPWAIEGCEEHTEPDGTSCNACKDGWGVTRKEHPRYCEPWPAWMKELEKKRKEEEKKEGPEDIKEAPKKE